MSDAARTIALSVPLMGGNEWAYVKECLDSQWVSSAGPFVARFERELAARVGAPHAVACVNGTAGLQVALRLAGVDAGDEVLVPTVTFIAPVNAIAYLQAAPVFMDCDAFMNLDAEKLRDFCRSECGMTPDGLRNRATGRLVKAILPVHVFGNPCDMESIMATAREFSLPVVEDATESLGAFYTAGEHAGRFTGAIGEFGVFSFNGNKIITTGGGGMITTADADAARRAAYLITQAKDDPLHYVHDEVGYNYRLTSLQAAVGVAQLEELDGFIAVKKRNYELYRELLDGVDGLSLLGRPENTSPNFWFYSLVVERDEFGVGRDDLMARLRGEGIETRPLWTLNHCQKPYREHQAYRIEKAPWFRERVLNLPCSTCLGEEDLRRVAMAIRAVGGGRAA